VPYYLVFYPEAEDLTLYHHNGKKYVTVKPNKRGRYAISELEIEVKILDGWVRFWYQGQLLPLPADMQRELDAANRRAREADRRAADLQRRLELAEQELARFRTLGQPLANRKNNGPKSGR